MNIKALNWRSVQSILSLCILISACSLDEGTSEFVCGDPDDTLFETPPADTILINIESTDLEFNKTFTGVRIASDAENPVEGLYENLSTYTRPASGSGRLYGLGTKITDESDSSEIVIAFNLSTGTELDEVCRSSKVFKREHDWSKWNDDIPGVEVLMKVPVNGEIITFSSDTSQEDEDIMTLDGAEFLDDYGFYARLGGSFTVKLKELGSTNDPPLEVYISGSFILNMRVSK